MNEKIIIIDLGGVNSYLVKSGNSFVLFDTGGPLFMDKHFNNRCSLLESELDKAGCKPDNLKLLVLTHGDFDHVFNAIYIKEKYKVSIAMRAEDLELVTNPTIQKVLENCQYGSGINKIVSQAAKIFIKKASIKVLEKFQKFCPDLLIDNSFNMHKYGVLAEVLHLPGHTPGSIGVLFKDGSLICGDTFYNQTKPRKAPNAYSFQELDKTLENLNKYKINIIYPGHGTPFPYAELKL